MLTIPANDTLIGFTLGVDIGTAKVGAYAAAAKAFTAFLGYQGQPLYRNYIYPNITNSDWILKTASGMGAPMHWAMPAGPGDLAPQDILAGAADVRYQWLGQQMVQYGFGQGIFNPGLEGSGNNFPNTAGKIGDDLYGKLVGYGIAQLRKVPGWDQYCTWNYSVADCGDPSRPLVKNPDAAFAGCQSVINGIEMDQYDVGGYTKQGWTAQDHAACWKNDVLPRLMKQLAFADKYGLRMGVGESASMIKSDGHGGGDSRYYLDHVAAWIDQYNPSHWFFYVGQNLPGDNCRWAAPATKDGLAWSVDPLFAKETAPAMRTQFDPARFKDKNVSPYVQIKALQAQVAGVQQQLATAQAQIATDQATVAGLQAQIATLQATLDALQAQNSSLQAQNSTVTTKLGVARDALAAATNALA